MRKHLLDYIDRAKSHNVRGLRILVEYFYAEEIFSKVLRSDIHIVSVFGSARIQPGAKEYEDAKKLGALLYDNGFAVVTGASQGIMQAANEGVADALMDQFRKLKKYKSDTAIRKSPEFKDKIDHYSLGLKISLPFESENNPYLGVVATFHYFMVRKFFFGSMSSAFIACEGGWGTRDEMFEILTLVQTGKAPLMPVIYISDSPKHLQDDVDYALKKKYISPEDRSLLQIVSDYRQAVEIIKKFYSIVKKICYDNSGNIDIFLQHEITAKQQALVTRLVENKYQKNFAGGVKFFKNKFQLRGFNYRSYGIVRTIIDSL